MKSRVRLFRKTKIWQFMHTSVIKKPYIYTYNVVPLRMIVQTFDNYFKTYFVKELPG